MPGIHVNLKVEGAKPGQTQPVEVEAEASGRFRVLYSPGLVEGIAAGDLVEVLDSNLGEFAVIERGSNICIKWAGSSSIESVLPKASEILERLDARLDGSVTRAAVWTLPFRNNFPEIESAMEEVCRLQDDSLWWYGNVYDSEGKPLEWW